MNEFSDDVSRNEPTIGDTSSNDAPVNDGSCNEPSVEADTPKDRPTDELVRAMLALANGDEEAQTFLFLNKVQGIPQRDIASFLGWPDARGVNVRKRADRYAKRILDLNRDEVRAALAALNSLEPEPEIIAGNDDYDGDLTEVENPDEADEGEGELLESGDVDPGVDDSSVDDGEVGRTRAGRHRTARTYATRHRHPWPDASLQSVIRQYASGVRVRELSASFREMYPQMPNSESQQFRRNNMNSAQPDNSGYQDTRSEQARRDYEECMQLRLQREAQEQALIDEVESLPDDVLEIELHRLGSSDGLGTGDDDKSEVRRAMDAAELARMQLEQLKSSFVQTRSAKLQLQIDELQLKVDSLAAVARYKMRRLQTVTEVRAYRFRQNTAKLTAKPEKKILSYSGQIVASVMELKKAMEAGGGNFYQDIRKVLFTTIKNETARFQMFNAVHLLVLADEGLRRATGKGLGQE
jgi:hypothetical protein